MSEDIPMFTLIAYNLYLLKDKIYKARQVLLLPFAALFMVFITIACGSEQTSTNVSVNSTIAIQSSTAVSIVTVQKTTETVGSMPNDWQWRWLKGIPCRPPCWEGIIPGQTNDQDALKLLEQSFLVKSGTPRSRPPGSEIDYGRVAWNWKVEEPSTLTAIGRERQIYYNATPDKLVYLIRPGFSGYKLSDIIQSYGAPSHIVALDETNPEGYPLNFVVKFVYLNQGFMVESRSEANPILSKDMTIDHPQFFIPGLPGFIAMRYPPSRYLMPWEGYKPFSFYCWEVTGVDQRCRRL